MGNCNNLYKLYDHSFQFVSVLGRSRPLTNYIIIGNNKLRSHAIPRSQTKLGLGTRDGLDNRRGEAKAFHSSDDTAWGGGSGEEQPLPQSEVQGQLA